MKYELSLKFNKHSVRKAVVEAASRSDLDDKIKLKPFWHRNRDRTTIGVREP